MTKLEIVGIVALSIIIAIEVTLFFLELADRRRERADRKAQRADRDAFQGDYDRFMRDDKTAPRS